MKKLEFENTGAGIKTVWLLTKQEANKIIPGFDGDGRKDTKQERELETLVQDTEYFSDGKNQDEFNKRLKEIKKIRRKYEKRNT